MGRGAGLRNLTRHSEHHRDGVFCGGDHIAKGRVHHNHAFFRGCGTVDIIHPNAGPANHLEIGCGIDNFFCGFGRRANSQTIILINDSEQFVLVFANTWIKIHVDTTITEDLNRSFREFVRYEYFRGHVGTPYFKREESGAPSPSSKLLCVKLAAVSPFQPGQHRQNVCGFNRGTAPHTQACWRVAIGANVEGSTLRLQTFRDRFGKACRVLNARIGEF